MIITVDPSTDTSGFGYAEAGRYRLRVIDITQEQGQKAPYLQWKCEFADPNVQSVDKRADGNSKKIGCIFENTTLSTKNNGQFRLRQICEALGLTWGNFDTSDCVGREFTADIGIKEYNGNLSNEIKSVVVVGK